VETLTDQQTGWSLSGGTPVAQGTQSFTADTFAYNVGAGETTFGAASTEEDVRGGFTFGSPPPSFQGADAMTQQYCGGIDADGVHCALGKPIVLYNVASYGYVADTEQDICYSNTRRGPCVIPQPGTLYWLSSTYYHYFRNAEETRLDTVQKEDKVLRPSGVVYSDVTSTLHTYTWDAAGFAATKDGQRLTWTATGRLATVGSNAMTYDAEGRLTSVEFSDGTTWQSRYGGLVMADASGNPLYLDLGACRINLVNNTTLYRHPDLRGNAGKSTSNDAGQITSVNSYTPYGVESRQGTDLSDRMTFAQGLVDGSLVFLGPRVFDEDALQFLSPDPAYGLLHQYTYAQGDPIHYIDDGWEVTQADAYQYQRVGVYGGFFGGAVGGAVGGAIGAELGAPQGEYAGQVMGATMGAIGAQGLYRKAYYLVKGEDIESATTGVNDMIYDQTGVNLNAGSVPPHVVVPSTENAIIPLSKKAIKGLNNLVKDLHERLLGALSGLGGYPVGPGGQYYWPLPGE